MMMSLMPADIASFLDPGRLPSWLGGVVEYWRAGGPVMAVIALVTLLFWYRYFSVSSCLREMLADSDESRAGIGRAPADSVPLDRVRGAVPRVIVRVRQARRRGISLPDAFDEARTAETGFCLWAFYVMGALVTVAPLLGLLGTVVGMVTTFRAVAGGSESGGQEVAMGISQALITTQAGLASALAGTFALAHAHRLYRRLQHTLDRLYYHLALESRLHDANDAAESGAEEDILAGGPRSGGECAA